MQLDTSKEFGRRVERRLQEDQIMWLTTLRGDLTPQPSPVWFLWDGESFLIYSQPNTQKLRNIARHPTVALNLDGDGRGGNIIVFNGTARIDPDAPKASDLAAYVEKYREGFTRIQMTPEGFSGVYSVAIRVTPTSLRGH